MQTCSFTPNHLFTFTDLKAWPFFSFLSQIHESLCRSVTYCIWEHSLIQVLLYSRAATTWFINHTFFCFFVYSSYVSENIKQPTRLGKGLGAQKNQLLLWSSRTSTENHTVHRFIWSCICYCLKPFFCDLFTCLESSDLQYLTNHTMSHYLSLLVSSYGNGLILRDLPSLQKKMKQMEYSLFLESHFLSVLDKTHRWKF